MKFLIIGNPENRRVTLFQAALREAGQPEAEIISWRGLLTDFEVLRRVPDEPRLVRIDSYGEDFEVERQLLLRGGFERARSLVESRGEVIAPAATHRGFQSVLRELEAVFASRPEWRVLNLPRELDEFFDKRKTQRRFHAEGIAIPEFLDEPPGDADALLEVLRARGWPESFVKPAMGSSASGVLLVTLAPRPSIRTSLESSGGRYFNNLRLSNYQRPDDVRRVLNFVLSQGAQVERAIPKAKLNDAFFDCRVLCIDGEPRFTVVRQNKHPITNLHLGGWRGELTALREALKPGAWERAMETCRRVASLYESLHVGLDVLFERDLRHHRVIEANAFGDLLPNLTVGGRSVYAWEIDAALKRSGMRSSNPEPNSLPSSR